MDLGVTGARGPRAGQDRVLGLVGRLGSPVALARARRRCGVDFFLHIISQNPRRVVQRAHGIGVFVAVLSRTWHFTIKFALCGHASSAGLSR